jgi:hypothetical protein
MKDDGRLVYDAKRPDASTQMADIMWAAAAGVDATIPGWQELFLDRIELAYYETGDATPRR